ncbi:MAG: hypothetical protein ACLSVX_01895 [Massilimicrobiota timonensis]
MKKIGIALLAIILLGCQQNGDINKEPSASQDTPTQSNDDYSLDKNEYIEDVLFRVNSEWEYNNTISNSDKKYYYFDDNSGFIMVTITEIPSGVNNESVLEDTVQSLENANEFNITSVEDDEVSDMSAKRIKGTFSADNEEYNCYHEIFIMEETGYTFSVFSNKEINETEQLFNKFVDTIHPMSSSVSSQTDDIFDFN